MANLEERVTRLEIAMERVSEAIEKMSETLSRQEILFERLSSLKSSHEDNIKNIHKRIDEINEAIEKKEDLIFKLINENKQLITKLEKQSEKKDQELKDLINNKPCITHNLVENEIKHLKEKLENHSKIFWWVQVAMGGTLITAIVKSVLH